MESQSTEEKEALILEPLFTLPAQGVKNYQEDLVGGGCGSCCKKTLRFFSSHFSSKQEVRKAQCDFIGTITLAARKTVSNTTMAFMLVYGAVSKVIAQIENEHNIADSKLLLECNTVVQQLTVLGIEQNIISSHLEGPTLVSAMKNQAIKELNAYTRGALKL